jgi:hypothetical protein
VGVGQALTQLPGEWLGGGLVAPAVRQARADTAASSHGPPGVVALAPERREDLAQVPRAARAGAPPPGRAGGRLATLPAPPADGLVGHEHAAADQERLHAAAAEAVQGVQPDATAEDRDRQAAVLRAVGRWRVQATRMAHQAGTGQGALHKLTVPGKISATVSDDQVGFIIFGACTPF